MMYHNLFARRSEFGVADSRFGRCFPMASLHMPSTWTLMRACAPANSAAFFSRLRSVAVGDPRKRHQVVTTRLFWSHPYQSPRLRRSASPAVPPSMRAARLRRPGSAWTAASNAFGLGCWALQLAAGPRNGADATPLEKASTTQRALSLIHI